MTNKEPKPGPRTVWAYAYEFTQPQPADRMHAVQGLLDREETEARKDSRSWGSRFVTKEQVTHILVVNDSPRQDLEVNRLLEMELKEMKAGFSITAALAIDDEDDESVVPLAGRAGSPWD
jgi:hypothetical protein